MCVRAIGPDYREDMEETFRLMESARNIFSAALNLLAPADLIELLLQPQYSYWANYLNPFFELLDEILFVATRGKEGKIAKAHKSLLGTDTLNWLFAWFRNVFRQVKNPVPGDIRNFLRQAKKITCSLQETRSVEIIDKAACETLVAFLRIAQKYQ